VAILPHNRISIQLSRWQPPLSTVSYAFRWLSWSEHLQPRYDMTNYIPLAYAMSSPWSWALYCLTTKGGTGWQPMLLPHSGCFPVSPRRTRRARREPVGV